MKNKKCFLNHLPMVISALGMTCGNVWATEHPSEQDYFQELPVVLSASRLSQPLSETPNAVTVISHEMINALGYRNIADVFKLVPGMYVGYVNGHTPIVSYRGNTDAYARRMQVLVDGRSIYLPLFGEVDWAELPLDIGDIERIEVVRGPSAASHGSNSVQGVINIITRRPSDAPKAQVSARWGEAGVSDVSARLGGMGGSWDYRVTMASRGDTGFDPKSEVVSIPLNDNSRTNLINAQINYRLASSDTLDARFGYSNSSRGLGDLKPDPAPYGIVSPFRDQKVSSDFQQLTWVHTFDANNDLKLNYFHIGRNTKDERYTVPCVTCKPAALNLIASGSYAVNDDALIHRHDLELQHTFSTSPGNRVVWGIGARQDSVDAPNDLRYAPVTWREYRVFGHDEWRITPASLVNIGAMVEKNALDQTHVSPRVSYNYHLTSQDTLRASVSVAHRNPEMVEEFGGRSILLNKVGNTQYVWRDILAAGGLNPEYALSREIGYVKQLDQAGSTLDIRAYHDQISNIIWVDPVINPSSVISPRGYTSSFTSDFNAHHSGLEGTLNYIWGAHSKLIINYAHQIADAVPSRVSPVASTNAALISFANKYNQTVPRNSASALLLHDFSGGVQVGAGIYHTDPVQILDAGTLQPYTNYLDLRIAKRFGSRKDKEKGSSSSEIALVIQNVLNDNYFDYSPTTVPKRRVYLTATLGF